MLSLSSGNKHTSNNLHSFLKSQAATHLSLIPIYGTVSISQRNPHYYKDLSFAASFEGENLIWYQVTDGSFHL